MVFYLFFLLLLKYEQKGFLFIFARSVCGFRRRGKDKEDKEDADDVATIMMPKQQQPPPQNPRAAAHLFSYKLSPSSPKKNRAFLVTTVLSLILCVLSVTFDRKLPRALSASSSSNPFIFSESRAMATATTIEQLGSRAVGTESEQLAFEFIRRRVETIQKKYSATKASGEEIEIEIRDDAFSGLRKRDADEITRNPKRRSGRARTTNLGGYGGEGANDEENEETNDNAKKKKWGISDVYRYDNLRSISVRVRRRRDTVSFSSGKGGKDEEEYHDRDEYEGDVNDPYNNDINNKMHVIAISVHVDTVSTSSGGSDNAASCGIALEVLENVASLATNKETRNFLPAKTGIVFHFLTAEEVGLIGATATMKSHPWFRQKNAKPSVIVNLESMGSGGPQMLFKTEKGIHGETFERRMLETWAESVPYPNSASVYGQIFRSGVIPSETDGRVYNEKGAAVIDLAFVERSFVYHTSRDRVKGMRRGSAQASGENIVAFVGAFLQKRDQFADVDSELNPDISLRQGVESHAWYVRPGFILAKTKLIVTEPFTLASLRSLVFFSAFSMFFVVKYAFGAHFEKIQSKSEKIWQLAIDTIFKAMIAIPLVGFVIPLFAIFMGTAFGAMTMFTLAFLVGEAMPLGSYSAFFMLFAGAFGCIGSIFGYNIASGFLYWHLIPIDVAFRDRYATENAIKWCLFSGKTFFTSVLAWAVRKRTDSHATIWLANLAMYELVFVFAPVIARQSGFLHFMPSVSIVPNEENNEEENNKVKEKKDDDDTVSSNSAATAAAAKAGKTTTQLIGHNSKGELDIFATTSPNQYLAMLCAIPCIWVVTPLLFRAVATFSAVQSRADPTLGDGHPLVYYTLDRLLGGALGFVACAMFFSVPVISLGATLKERQTYKLMVVAFGMFLFATFTCGVFKNIRFTAVAPQPIILTHVTHIDAHSYVTSDFIALARVGAGSSLAPVAMALRDNLHLLVDPPRVLPTSTFVATVKDVKHDDKSTTTDGEESGYDNEDAKAKAARREQLRIENDQRLKSIHSRAIQRKQAEGHKHMFHRIYSAFTNFRLNTRFGGDCTESVDFVTMKTDRACIVRGYDLSYYESVNNPKPILSDMRANNMTASEMPELRRTGTGPDKKTIRLEIDVAKAVSWTVAIEPQCAKKAALVDPSNPSELTWIEVDNEKTQQVENTPFTVRQKGKRILFSGSGRLTAGDVVDMFIVPAKNNKHAHAGMSEKIQQDLEFFCRTRGAVLRTDFETRTDLMEDIIGTNGLPRNVAPFGKSDLPRWYSLIRDIDLSPL